MQKIYGKIDLCHTFRTNRFYKRTKDSGLSVTGSEFFYIKRAIKSGTNAASVLE